ncbi:UDP-N-acetylmuramoyl-L-alanyl-D-glutamate--2,6-diaminopimelate ligase [Teredinibacter sp. KSP-S5-2]|uniref:UDP-N-acetylmuramoyl-L-alanyl-D-glutamate--2, 6-diaminopimelate ligase n=1 Tax=Teredinibacter sp. KSP-S5-2 TaxID=3034506 RepID=UPI002934273A|nr:UDP-N-acetylmuramoyl-L-alanyl-D-glutamate--2,6-diaminopimelate ligase [Teredinibacter sp. KSP-S5-2]WNO09613.1 UDP-N-acetylmuramoyl-L-alanyl-D-glutamate--2,6-diaminopimelate ligase [Teredinibacter sp. KSP-S5-2]
MVAFVKQNIQKLLADLPVAGLLEQELLEREITGIANDSRQIKPGDVFVAIKGEAVDGRDFIDSAIAAGAVFILADATDNNHGQLSIRKSVPVLSIEGLGKKIGILAGKGYGQPTEKLSVVGVTGTNGKSTCVSLIAQLLSLLGEKSASVGTVGYGCYGEALINTGLTTPDAIQIQRIAAEFVQQNVKHFAMEVSSHGVTQGRVDAVNFDVAVFTNLTRDHLDYHGTFEAYQKAKFDFVSRSDIQKVVINLDDQAGVEESVTLKELEGKSVTSYALNNREADVVASDIEFRERGMEFDVTTPWGAGHIRTQLIGDFNIHNLLAVMSVACLLGHDFKKVTETLEQLVGVEGRLELLSVPESDLVVLIDYAHTPDALEKAILAVKAHVNKTLTVVFGCGGDRDKGKRPLMGEVAEQLADQVLITSDNPRTEEPIEIIQDILSGVSNCEKVRSLVDRKEAIHDVIAKAEPGDCILVAGKGHEDYQEINGLRLPFSDHAIALDALKQRVANQKGALCT